jgi:hypothetical protein
MAPSHLPHRASPAVEVQREVPVRQSDGHTSACACRLASTSEFVNTFSLDQSDSSVSHVAQKRSLGQTLRCRSGLACPAYQGNRLHPQASVERSVAIPLEVCQSGRPPYTTGLKGPGPILRGWIFSTQPDSSSPPEVATARSGSPSAFTRRSSGPTPSRCSSSSA